MLETEVRTALGAPHARLALLSRVQSFVTGGLPRELVARELCDVRRSLTAAGNLNAAALVADAEDRLSGWCRPALRI